MKNILIAIRSIFKKGRHNVMKNRIVGNRFSGRFGIDR